MLFNPAHTVLNQRANARKASVETTNLIGHWDPNDAGSYNGAAGGTTYNNLVTSKEDLKIYDATFNWLGSNPVIEEPFYFSFNGNDAKIADIDTSDPYNDNFEIRQHYSWAISMWVKFHNFADTNKLWTLGDDGDALLCTMDEEYESSLSLAVGKARPAVWCDTMQIIPPALSAGEWHMVTWRHTPIQTTSASKIDIFYDGILQDCAHYDTDSEQVNDWTNTWAIVSNVGAQDLDIGWYEDDDEFINSST